MINFLQGSIKGPDPLGDDPNAMPPRFFKDNMTAAEKKSIVMKAYERLKVSLDKFLKPDGSKEAPAKTCADILYHHPKFESGMFLICIIWCYICTLESLYKSHRTGGYRNSVFHYCFLYHPIPNVLRKNLTEDFG